MHNENIPEYTELPSNKKLLRSTIIAVISAAVILVTIVLPAEFGIDPTGIGSITGLKRMGEIKTSLADELQAEQSSPTDSNATPAIAESTGEPQSNTMSVILAPGESTEVKLTMLKDNAVEFSWTSDAGDAFYDLHGDSKEINYHVYEKGTESAMQGTLTAAFDGNHGWYWKNRSQSPITITITATGEYQSMKEMN